MATPDVDRELVDLMSAVFGAHRERHTAKNGDQKSSAAWDLELWTQLSDLGLARLTGAETAGGSGAGWFEAAELLRAAAAHGVPVPVVEHDLLAGRLLEAADLPVDDARRTATVLDGTGMARGVGWAAEAERIVLAWSVDGTCHVADVDPAVLHITPGTNLAGEPRDTVRAAIADLRGTLIADAVVDEFVLRGALARAIQVSGALERILEVTITHVTHREQFGRPLGRFQAVQHLVADIAAEVALARTATDAALRVAVGSRWSDPNLEFAIAVARSNVGRAASTVVRNAHQVHGAIGTTREHRLHEFTLPALAWRSEFGSVHHWEQVVMAAALDAGRDGLWTLVTA